MGFIVLNGLIRIHDEWIQNVLKSRPDLSKEKLERTKQMMNQHVLDALVENFESIEKTLNLPDSGDNHVLAAAIASSSDIIVTYNLKDFPNSQLVQYHVESQHPDQFLMLLSDLDQQLFLMAVKKTRLRLKNLPKSIDEYLEILNKQKLIKTVGLLKKHKNKI